MKLKNRCVRYSLSDLRSWKAGNYQFLKQSGASESVKKVLIEKARRRRQTRVARDKAGDRRFFGEAVVAAHPEFAHQAGWYASFKWLSAPVWCASPGLQPPGLHSQFKAALDKHVKNLKDVQASEVILRSRLGGKHAVPPDLWLFTGKRHHFIEVKLPGDDLSEAQLAGLALIATCLKATHPLTVEIARLSVETDRCEPLSDEERDKFTFFCSLLRASTPAGQSRHGWRWRVRHVDRASEHIEIRYGDASETAYAEWVPVALVGKPVNHVFPVQWMKDAGGEAMTEVRRELDFYLVEHPASHPHTGHPWDYAVYHCGTAANVYSPAHWSYFPGR